METAVFTQTMVYIHQTVRLHNPEEHALHIHRAEKLKIISIRLLKWCNDRVVLSLFRTARILSDRFVILCYIL
jgi:hypothetical protein